MNETSSETNEQIDKEISMEIVPVIMNNNIQAITPKSMVPNPRWFDGNQIKFEDWWRGIQLFFKSNRVLETNNRITAILACLREGVASIYT